MLLHYLVKNMFENCSKNRNGKLSMHELKKMWSW